MRKKVQVTPDNVTSWSSIKVWWKCPKGHIWKAMIANRSKGVGCPYCAGKKVGKDNCLLTVNPELSKAWHPVKNGTLTPNDVTRGSDKKIWWICKKGHEWQAAICRRVIGKGCPFCCGQRVSKDNCLSTVKPELSKQWHPIKNGTLTPNDVTRGSHIKVWWVCEKGHEWEAVIKERSRGYNCPFCCNQRVCEDNCLSMVNPELSKQWHPIKNGTLTPYNVTHGSEKRIWWICKNGHEWIAQVCNRSNGKGCPFCNKQRSLTLIQNDKVNS